MGNKKIHLTCLLQWSGNQHTNPQDAPAISRITEVDAKLIPFYIVLFKMLSLDLEFRIL